MRWVETRCIASLDSEIPEGIILSILTDYEKADVEKVIEEIIYKLQKASKRESQLNKSIQQLLVLSRLRKFDKKIEQKINNMPIIYDISNANPPLPAPKGSLRGGLESFGPWEKTDGLYNEGIREGRKEGVQEGIERRGVEIALNLIREGLDSSTISKVTGLTISQIEALRQVY